ncbi:hypothetical protein RHSIM_Rhsim02G0065400 [Rhododendron simsii]|uniref:SWIM-type domain-containing protein n=1 Tax=Rhododendron simsii TaxID=118357 RepID=A0A834HKG7_RHOSS|nr:hypothetical protein RHSIM_Rhsim02G0065400 [Rhododendron simsii]
MANRDSPINGTSGVLSLNPDGKFVIYDNTQNRTNWHTNVSAVSYSAQLLDSRSLVLFRGDSGSGDVVWQSFDHPTNTVLPNMTLGGLGWIGGQVLNGLSHRGNGSSSIRSLTTNAIIMADVVLMVTATQITGKSLSTHAFQGMSPEAEARANCITWYENLMDVRRHVRRFPSGGLDLYVRVDAIELEMGDQYFSFEVHHGGQFVWNPQVAYVGGKVDYVGEFNPARLSLFEIRDVHVLQDMLEMYKGLTVIVIYVDKLMDPLLVMSSNGEILSSSPVMPSGLVIDLSDNDEGAGVKDFGAETITETEVEDIGDENLTEVGDIEDENGTGVEEGARMECDLSDVDSEGSNYVASEEDNDEVSDDDSSMYEDLEAPDDDIFEVNSHRRVAEQPQPQPTNADVNTDEKWYSDLEDEENLSLKGSSDEEGDGHPEFKEKIHMANPILVEGMKFTGARQFRKFLKEWNVVNGYDIKYKKNEFTRITAVCRQYDNRQANSSYIGKKLLDEIKDNPTINITSFKNKIRRKIMVDASRYCLRHMYSNFKVKFPGAFLKDLFWKAASTCSVSGFNYWMRKIEEADPKLNERRQTAAEWLRAVTPSLWARSHFNTRSKCDVVVNNISESFNSYILEARELPIISMFEWIRKRVMQRIQVKKAGMQKYTGHLCPNIQEKIEKLKVESRLCVAAWCGELEFEVDYYDRTYIVDLRTKICSCCKWQLTGIPCCHAIAAIQKNKEHVETYVHPYFTKSGYLAAYSYMIHPVPDMLDFVETGFQPLNPPNSKRGSGRPKKLRRRTADEPRDPNKVTRRGLNVTCAKCMQVGHNQRSCKNRIHPKSKLVKNGQKSNATSQPMGTHTDVPPTTVIFRIISWHKNKIWKRSNQKGANGKGMTTSTGRGTNGRGVTTGGTGSGRGRGAGSSQPPIGSSSQPVGKSIGRGVTGRGRGVGSTQPPTGSSSQPIGRGAGRGGKASSSGPVGGPSLATVLQNIRAKKQARVTGM